jgi:hypothetical protein
MTDTKAYNKVYKPKGGVKKKKNFTTSQGNKARLTYKQKKLEDLALQGMSRTQAAMKVYNTSDYSVAASIASENLKKPQVIIYREEHVDKAKARIVELVDSENESVALKASDSILDRQLGKATQRIEQNTTVTEVSNDQISNAASLAAQFVMFLKAGMQPQSVEPPTIDDVKR